jgi:hypothetical protein
LVKSLALLGALLGVLRPCLAPLLPGVSLALEANAMILRDASAALDAGIVGQLDDPFDV